MWKEFSGPVAPGGLRWKAVFCSVESIGCLARAANFAISKGMRLKYSEGLLKDDDVIACETEEGVFSALGLPCPSPKNREIVDYKPVWMKQ